MTKYADLRARVERLQAENHFQQITIERLREDYDRPEVLPEHIERISENQLNMIEELRTENEQLRTALAKHHKKPSLIGGRWCAVCELLV